MVLPLLAVAAGGAVASGLLQFMNSERAREANQSEINRIKALYEKVSTPDFDSNDLTPEEYKLVGKYTPEAVPYVQEEAPKFVKADSADAQLGREAQRRALASLMQQGTRSDPLYQSELDQAQRAAASQAGSVRQSILQDRARRGDMNSGMSLAAELAGVGQVNAQSQDAAAAAALQAQRARLQALTQGASLGSQIRGEDVALESQNTGLLNAYNQRLAAAMQANQQLNVQQRNAAQMSNLAAQQQAQDQNTQQRNAYAKANRDYANQMAQNAFNNTISLNQAKSGLATQQMNQNTGSAQDRNQAIQGITSGVTSALMMGANAGAGATPNPATGSTAMNTLPQPNYYMEPENPYMPKRNNTLNA